jgi:hypothetical protein
MGNPPGPIWAHQARRILWSVSARGTGIHIGPGDFIREFRSCNREWHSLGPTATIRVRQGANFASVDASIKEKQIRGSELRGLDSIGFHGQWVGGKTFPLTLANCARLGELPPEEQSKWENIIEKGGKSR